MKHQKGSKQSAGEASICQDYFLHPRPDLE
jgi:hypothetical protein